MRTQAGRHRERGEAFVRYGILALRRFAEELLTVPHSLFAPLICRGLTPLKPAPISGEAVHLRFGEKHEQGPRAYMEARAAPKRTRPRSEQPSPSALAVDLRAARALRAPPL